MRLKGKVVIVTGAAQGMVGACLFLLPEESARVTGQILAIDGGQTFRP